MFRCHWKDGMAEFQVTWDEGRKYIYRSKKTWCDSKFTFGVFEVYFFKVAVFNNFRSYLTIHHFLNVSFSHFVGPFVFSLFLSNSFFLLSFIFFLFPQYLFLFSFSLSLFFVLFYFRFLFFRFFFLFSLLFLFFFVFLFFFFLITYLNLFHCALTLCLFHSSTFSSHSPHLSLSLSIYLWFSLSLFSFSFLSIFSESAF